MGGYFQVLYIYYLICFCFFNCGYNGLPMETTFLFSVSSDNSNTTDNDSCTITSPAQIINHKTVANFYLLSVIVGQFRLYYYSTFKWHKERRSLTLKPLFYFCLLPCSMSTSCYVILERGEERRPSPHV